MWRRATSTTPLLACRIAGSLIPVGSAIARLDIPLRKKVVRRMHGVFFDGQVCGIFCPIYPWRRDHTISVAQTCQLGPPRTFPLFGPP
jgi:hypothetical protein